MNCLETATPAIAALTNLKHDTTSDHPFSVPAFKEFVLSSSYLTHAHSTSSSKSTSRQLPLLNRMTSLAALHASQWSSSLPRNRQDGPSQPQVQHTYTYESSQATIASNGGGAAGAAGPGTGGTQLEDSKHLPAANVVGIEKQLVSRTQQEVKTQQVQPNLLFGR